MSKMKDEDIERNYREAGLTESTVARITQWIQATSKEKTCNCDCGGCGESND